MLLHRFYEKLIQNCPPFSEEDVGGPIRWANAKIDYADEIDDFNPFLADEDVPRLHSDALPVAGGLESIFPVDIIVGKLTRRTIYIAM
jgi:hypothetical protein